MDRWIDASNLKQLLSLVALVILGVAVGLYAYLTGEKMPVPAHALDSGSGAPNATDGGPRIAQGGGTWIVVWQSKGRFGPDSDIVFARSTDAGEHWSAPALLHASGQADGATDDESQPHLATDGQGHWVAVWSSSADPVGATGSDADLFVARSSDDGLSWSTPQVLNSQAGTDAFHDGLPYLATDGQGHWVVFWQVSGAPGTTPSALGTYYARSADNGQNWSSQAYIPTYGGGHPAVATDGKGTWVAVWWGAYQPLGQPKAFYALSSVSQDHGQTWSAALALPYGANPADSSWPRVATDRLGHWLAVWSSMDDLSGSIGTEPDILAARSTAPASTWTGLTAMPSAKTDSGGTWDVTPALATDGQGHWVVVWGTYGDSTWTIGTDHDVLIAQSQDNGATWSNPAPLDDDATSDTVADGNPDLAIDGQGRAVAVWVSDHGAAAGGGSSIRVGRFKVPFAAP